MNGTTVVLSLIDAVLYRGAPNTTTIPTTSGTKVTTVENLTLKLTYDEAPANNRQTPIKQSLPSLLGVELEANFPSDSADTHLAAFRSALINRYPLPLLISDGSDTGYRFGGVMGVFGGDNDQALPSVPMNKFTLRPWAVGFTGNQPSVNN